MKVLPGKGRTSGVALVIVLGMLTLMAALAIAFLSSVSTELRSAKSFASGTDTKALADTAVNVVISQIQDGTARPDLAWASQPGMIRTYDNSGDPVAGYKLYSSSALRIEGAPMESFDPEAALNTEIASNWASLPDRYTDLNKPVIASDGTHYPIVDPAAVGTSATDTTQSLAGGSTPIEGCFINTVTPILSTGANQTNPLPMPVQWLYVLKDGTLAPIDTATGKISGAGDPLPDGSKNSIVGRVAFWTDDESCKVNVNTASEGTFWDRPWADGVTGSYERTLDSSSPLQNEFQRYPGHPAMTSLSGIFPPSPNELNPDGTLGSVYKERIYGIIPRVIGGGSVGGTTAVTFTSAPLVPDADRLFASVDEFLFGIKVKADPQDSTKQIRDLNLKYSIGSATSTFTDKDIAKSRFFLTATSRAPDVNMFNKPRIALWPLQANTAAVEQPKDALERNAKDRLIAACTSVGNEPFYFQRYNTYDPTKARAGSASYSPAQSPVPSSQSPTIDWDLIPRNRQLFAYLQDLVRKPVPGLGGSLVGTGGKYSTPVGDQILTEMMDYVRSYVNTFRTKPANAVATEPPYYTYSPMGLNAQGNASGWVTGQGQVVPLVIQPPGASYKTKGFGRFSTITQASLVFYRSDKLQYVPNPAVATDEPKEMPVSSSTLNGKITVLDLVPEVSFSIPGLSSFTPPADSPLNTEPNKPKMKAVLLLQVLNVSPGMPPWTSNFRCRVKGLESLMVKMGTETVSLGFPSNAVNLVNGDSAARYYSNTSLKDFEVLTEYWPHNSKTLGATSAGSSDEEKYYPYFSNEIDLTAKAFDLVGGDIEVEIYSGYSNPNGINPGDLVQTIRMSIPSTSTGNNGIPIPNVSYSNSYANPTTPPDPLFPSGKTTISSSNNYTDYDTRLAHDGYNSINAPHNHRPYIINPAGFRGDTVRSVQARYGFANGGPGGDLRLIAGLTDVPDTFFEGHGLKDAATDNITYNETAAKGKALHSLRAYVATGNNDDKSNGFYHSGNNTTGLTYISPAKTSHAKLVEAVAYCDPIASGGARPGAAPVAVQGLKGAYMNEAKTLLGDWDTGPGKQIDGPYVNKADEATSNIGWYVSGSYENAATIVETGASFSPNRQISSAVAFGSLPAAIDPQTPANSVPWRTLLFCRNPAAGTVHPGFGTPKTAGTQGPPYIKPPDHAFLDLFSMPIVEPYAISEPFSTAGKVNMNYQMVPFTYLTRNTAVRAVLKTTNLMAIPTTNGANYKSAAGTDYTITAPLDFRYRLNLSESGGTLEGFERRFTPGKFSLTSKPDIFRSASEICDIYLVPKESVGTTTASGNPTYSTMENWWLGGGITTPDGYKLTGDNVREQPYGHIYPRLTTKSNTYMVHVKAQSLKKAVNSPDNEFVEGRDQVSGEYRGAYIIQRYLDPNSDSLVKSDGRTKTDEMDPDGMVGPYKFRIVSSKRFAP